MTDAEWIESLHGAKNTDLTLEQAKAVQKMIVDGDLLHINSAFITALANLANTGKACYLGIRVERDSDGDFVLSDGADATWTDNAIDALMICQDHRDPHKPAQLHEPEPPTYDEAPAMKCDSEAREAAARALK